jgi:hypothetical protein
VGVASPPFVIATASRKGGVAIFPLFVIARLPEGKPWQSRFISVKNPPLLHRFNNLSFNQSFIEVMSDEN